MILRLVAFFVLCLASPAFAVTCALGPAVQNSTTNAADYDFASFTPTANATLVVIAAVRTTVAAGAMSTVSGTSLTWTRKTSGTFNAGADTIYIYWANTPSSTAASVYRVSVTGDNGAGIGAVLYVCTGSDLTTADPLKTAIINSATSTNPTTGTITAMSTTNSYMALWMGGLSSSNPANVSTPPSSGGGWSESSDAGFGTPTTNHSAAFRNGGETGTSISFTANSTTWGLGFVEVYNSGAGPTGWGELQDRRRNRLVR